MKTNVKNTINALLIACSLLAGSPAFALDKKCDGIVNIQPKINEIHQFITDSRQLDDASFDIKLNEINDSVNALYDTTLNCDPYMDNLLNQMVGAVNTIRDSRSNS